MLTPQFLDEKHNDVVRGDPSGGQHSLPHPHPGHRMSTNGEQSRDAACQGLHQASPVRALAPQPHQPYFTSMGCSFKVASHYPAQGHLSQKTTLLFLSPPHAKSSLEPHTRGTQNHRALVSSQLTSNASNSQPCNHWAQTKAGQRL